MELRRLARDDRYENPKMGKLLSTLLEQFGPREESRGILFCKTRKSTHCLYDWVRNNSGLQEAGIKAAILTGAGVGISYMTQVCCAMILLYSDTHSQQLDFSKIVFLLTYMHHYICAC